MGGCIRALLFWKDRAFQGCMLAMLLGPALIAMLWLWCFTQGFAKMNKLKKEALKLIASFLPENEIKVGQQGFGVEQRSARLSPPCVRLNRGRSV